MNDLFNIQFSSAEQVASNLSGEGEQLYVLLNQLRGISNLLYNGGLQGAFLDEMQARTRWIETQMQLLADEVSEAGRDLQTVIRMAQELDSESARRFLLPGQFLPYHPDWQQNPFATPYTLAPPTGSQPLDGVNFKNFPYHLIDGEYSRSFEGEYEGYYTPEELAKLIEDDPLATKWHNYVDAKATLFKVEDSASAALAEAQFTGDLGTVRVSAGEAEISAGASLTYGKDGIRAKTEAEYGIYAARVQANAQIAGADVTADAYVGANAQASTTAVFDPKSGEVALKGEAEFFVGGRAEAQAEIGLDAIGVDSVDVGVQGAISYGIGGKLNADIGMTDNKFRAEVELGATLGLGAEFGFTVELDVQEAANDITDFGRYLLNL